MPKRAAEDDDSDKDSRRMSTSSASVPALVVEIGVEKSTSDSEEVRDKFRRRSTNEAVQESPPLVAKKPRKSLSIPLENDSTRPTNKTENNDTKPNELQQTKDLLRKGLPEKSTSVSEPACSTSKPDLNLMSLTELKQKMFDLLLQLPILDSDKEMDTTKAILELRRIVNSEFGDECDSTLKKQTVDTFIRDFLLEHIVKPKHTWVNLLTFSIIVSKEGIGSQLLPISLLVDLIDLLGLKECEDVFNFLEARLQLWKQPHFYSCKNAVLRMCNDLLRRLSQIQHTIFCGRILLFLSAYFPFSERSGLNVMSEFNVENITTYTTNESTESDNGNENMDLSFVKEEPLFEGVEIEIPGLDKVVAQCQEQKKKFFNVDYSMYTKFWLLQEFLRNPNMCYNKTKWKTFALYLSDLLEALESSKLLVEYSIQPVVNPDDTTDCESGNQPNQALKSVSDVLQGTSIKIPTLEDENHYFAKYLTNRKVLEIEMCDPQFRRSFLVQLLIVFQYLLMPVKFKTDSHVLNEEQVQFVNKSTEKVYNILLEIKPGGASFVDTVKHILKREEIWNKWKNEGCPPLKKPTPPPVSVSTDPKAEKPTSIQDLKKLESGRNSAVEFEDSAGKRLTKPHQRIGSMIKAATRQRKFILGNAELDRLWNICPDNMAACRSKTRDFMPTVENYFAEAIKELDQDPSQPFDPKKEVKLPKKILGNGSFGWRGLRLLARRSPYFFQMVGTPIHPLQNYLEYLLRKIVADMDANNGMAISVLRPKTDLATTSAESAVKSQLSNGDNEQDTEMVTTNTEDDEDLANPTNIAAEEEGKDEQKDSAGEGIRNLTEAEQSELGRSLGDDWKRLGVKLGFTTDEIDYFLTEHKEEAGIYMLKLWTEQEGDDATVADLLYRLEGIGLRSKAEGILTIA